MFNGLNRDEFKSLNKKDKNTFVKNLIDIGETLKKDELEFISKSERERYLNRRIMTTDWLLDFEFFALTTRQQEVYIYKKKFLTLADFKRLSDNMQKTYINKAIINGLSLSEEEFEYLKSDALKRYYVKEKMKYDVDNIITPEEVKYLEGKDEFYYINTLLRQGLAIEGDYFNNLSKKAKKYYLEQIKLNEIKLIIREILKENL
ncbi:MAG TPA: hypothetical protein VLB82_03460 [Thermodesulfobacteriota bacterium]|nr:hypothetical protein [Thermodesulfobacteriota bacterium]